MNISGLIHRVGWQAAALSREPLPFNKVVFLVGYEGCDQSLNAYQGQLAHEGYVTEVTSDVMEIGRLLTPGTIVVHIPDVARTKNGVYNAVTRSCTSLIAAAQVLYDYSQNSQNQTSKLFCLISKDFGIGDLSYAPLHGVARVLKMEIVEVFGGLFEEDQGCFPLSAISHVQGFDVVKVCKGVAQTASLQPYQGQPSERKELRLNSKSTYLITGGTGGMGIEIATWMGERGARNIVLVSRRGIPPISDNKEKDENTDKLVSRISRLKSLGATVHVLAIDLSTPDAAAVLSQSVDKLTIPPIKGVVHAAGIAGYHTLKHCAPSDIASVLAPKVVGALNLDALFPPGTLDFFVLMSSVGQLVGFSGQLSYAPANAFLDGLAAQRRCKGDNSTSILWSSWRGVGMMAQSKAATRMITRGMEARGIADLTKEEAFEAWNHIASLGIDHAAVVRAVELEANEPLRHPMLKDITPRRRGKQKPATPNFNNYPEHAVAVVGMACRTAAGDTLDDLWEAIQAGNSMERAIDVKRFPDAIGKDKMWGNFLSDIDSFDHQFFKKSKRESAALDPHQRVLLETTYHALESTGCFGDGQPQAETHEVTENSQITGCFVGMNAPDYHLNLCCHPPSPYTGFGMLRSFVAGRLSHYFGWTGPSQTIDTACSSAMVAIHQACRAIQVGECTRAVAGGVNLITNTALFDALRAGGFLNNTGACKTFDARADGYCRGEAVGVVVLKRLDKALSDRDSIQGVLVSTGNNQNINSTSITNPVLESQTALYKDVLARAGVRPEDVSYVEAHGTGTRSGDPVETEGIRQVLGGKNRRSVLHIGSVKANLGHSEGASGVVSLMKVLLMIKHGMIPPQAHFQKLNSNIQALETDRMAISKSLIEWRDDLRLALVNSFGASGNNAAAIVAPPPPESSSSPHSMEAILSNLSISSWPFFISASSWASLSTYCSKLKTQIDSASSSLNLAQLAFALARRQNCQMQQVFCTTATSVNQLRAQLSNFETHTITNQKPKPIVFYENSVLFQTHLRQCDEMVQSFGLPSLFPTILQGVQGDSDLAFRHAAMFSIQYSCGMSWIDSGVRLDAICGHSFGEWAALTVSGAMTLEAGMRLITGYEEFWGDDTGSMVAIEADLAERHMTPGNHLDPFHKKHTEAKLEIACYNGPNNYVVAGSTIDIGLLESYLNDRKSNGERLRFKVLRGMHAYHSAMADSIIDDSARLSASIRFQDPTLPFESCQGEHWTGPGSNVIAHNTREPVYFAQAISRIVNRLGQCTFLEAGVGGPIVTMARNALPQSQAQTQHTFIAIHEKDPIRSLADATVTLWKTGQLNVKFWPFHRCQQASYAPVAVPPYQFEKHRHWLEYHSLSVHPGLCPHCLNNISELPYISRDRTQSQGVDRSVFKVEVSNRRYQGLVKGHKVVGSPICPAAMYLELASRAVFLLLGAEAETMSPEIVVEYLEIKAPLVCSSNRNGKTASHATGIVSLHSSSSMIDEKDEGDKWARTSSLLESDPDTEGLRGAMVYKVFAKMAKYSSAYRGLRYLVGKGPEGAGDIAIPVQELDSVVRAPGDNIADPLVIDNFLQVPGLFVHSIRATDEEEDDDSIAYICTGMRSVGPLNRLPGSGKYRAYTNVVQEDKKEVVLDVFAFNKQSSKVIWAAKGLKFSRVPRNTLAKMLERANPGMGSGKLSVNPSKPASQLQAHQIPDQRASSSTRTNLNRRGDSLVDILSGVKEILCKSLDVPLEDITKQTLLEELGVDSLVTSEIIANISDHFDVNITTDDFATVAEVAALCDVISSRLDSDAINTRSGDGENSGPDSVYEEVENTNLVRQKAVLEALSRSLDLPIAEIQMDSKLEDLGADSLVAGEIINDLNKAFSIDISWTEFASVVDVESICRLISSTPSLKSVQSSTNSSSGISFPVSSYEATIPTTPYTNANMPTAGKEQTPSQNNTGSIHRAFQQIRRNFDAHAKDTKFTGYWDRVYPQQLKTVTAFIAEGFAKLGCPIGKLRHGEKLPALQGALPKYRREITRLWEILEEADIVEKTGNDYLRGSSTHLGSDISNNTAGELSTKLISDFPHYASTQGLPALLGPHLADCLTGRADPVNLLFGSEKGRTLLEDFYANAPDLRAATQVLCDFLLAAVRFRGSNGEPFLVLEIGAGTGGTTKHLVPLLQAIGLPFIYTFTEISVSLLARAKKTFKGIEGMQFLKLDVEQHPPKELLGRYHVVVSTNCIHATRDLLCSLRNIRKMVRQYDGCVALIEVTQKLAWYDLVWGLLDGWWMLDDDREYPLQSPRESRSVRVICGMATELGELIPVKATSMLLHHRDSSSEDRNLFLAPDGFGSGAVFGALQPLLSRVKDVSVYALVSPFIKSKPDLEQPPTMEELAGIYVTDIKRRQPRGPYLVGGYSIGGVIAYEMVRQLLEDGNEVEKLFLIDTACPTFANSLPDTLVDFLDSIDYIGMVNEHGVRTETKGRLLTSDHFTLARQQLLRYKITKLPRGKTPYAVLVSAREGVDKQVQVPRPEVLPGEQRIVDWFLNDRIDDGSLGWDEFLGNVSVIRADGNHFSMMMLPKINSWGWKLAEQLAV
ncbi:hypothetical protein F5B20DRAFT_572644 [Whalleya microplaca]|nr:hypothetical protein F5B20DRAFT_572644 [Whalleya microplaca]